MEMKTLDMPVPAGKSKERLDKFLAAQLPSITRAKLKKLIDDEFVTIAGKPCKAGRLIRPGEMIQIVFPMSRPSEILPEPIPLTIVYEDSYLLVVNKPAGMVVHPAHGNMCGTLVNALLAHCEDLSNVGGGQRPGLVHRLDKDTSGLLVVAKDDLSHVELARQLSERKMEREYRAIVWGHPQGGSGRIEAPLRRSPKDRTKIVVSQEGKFAATNWETLQIFHLLSYLRLYLETGRTHQIRVHMNSIGHPVFADTAYGGCGRQLAGLNHADTQFAKDLLRKYNRQMLHAKTLAFIHPISKSFLRFEAPIPDDMQNMLDDLKQASV
jgi:23S rRNA pseudouridine1911/1915/1917 synthase